MPNAVGEQAATGGGLVGRQDSWNRASLSGRER